MTPLGAPRMAKGSRGRRAPCGPFPRPSTASSRPSRQARARTACLLACAPLVPRHCFPRMSAEILGITCCSIWLDDPGHAGTCDGHQPLSRRVQTTISASGSMQSVRSPTQEWLADGCSTRWASIRLAPCCSPADALRRCSMHRAGQARSYVWSPVSMGDLLPSRCSHLSM